MISFLYIWILMFISCVFRPAFSSQDFRERLCVASTDPHQDVYPKSKDACSKHTGILVEEIEMSTQILDEDCEECDESRNEWSQEIFTALHSFKLYWNQSREVELVLNQACNGRRWCHFDSSMPSVIPIPDSLSKDFYRTYVFKYSCVPVGKARRKKGQPTVLDMESNDSQSELEWASVLILNSSDTFNRHCIITAAPNGNITIDPLWISYNAIDHAWAVCFRIFDARNKSVYDVGCDRSKVRQKYPHNPSVLESNATIHVVGHQALVWIRLAADVPYEVTCREANPDFATFGGHYKELCISYREHEQRIPLGRNACPRGSGIHVLNIFATEEFLNEDCTDNRLSKSGPLHGDKQLTDQTHGIELVLKQACNGQRHCHVGHSLLPRIVDKTSPDNTYIVTYRCLPTETVCTGSFYETVAFDATKDFTERAQTAVSAITLRSEGPFSRECTVSSPAGTINLVPVWISYDGTTKKWDACLKVFKGSQTAFKEGCRNEIVGKAFNYTPREFPNTVTFHAEGNHGFVWLYLEGKDKRSIYTALMTCTKHFRITTPATQPYAITCKPKTNERTTKGDDSPLVIVAVTSTIAVLASVAVVCLVIYIIYIRKGSSYQRRKASKRLERRLTQQQQEGQHPRVQSQRERSLRRQQQQQQQQQQNGDSAYDLYTYMDENDIKTSSVQSKRAVVGAADAVVSPGAMVVLPNKDEDYYSTLSTRTDSGGPDPGRTLDNTGYSRVVKNGPEGSYSTDYYSQAQASTTAQGEYNQFGKPPEQREPRNGGVGADLYDTADSGSYAHFTDACKAPKIVGNFYDG